MSENIIVPIAIVMFKRNFKKDILYFVCFIKIVDDIGVTPLQICRGHFHHSIWSSCRHITLFCDILYATCEYVIFVYIILMDFREIVTSIFS